MLLMLPRLLLLVLLLVLLHLNLLLLTSVDSLGMVCVVLVEVIPRGNLLTDRHGRGAEHIRFLFCGLLLLRLERFLLLHALAAGEHFAEPTADVLEFKVRASHRTGVLLVALLLRVDTLVIGKVDIVDFFLIFCFGCHFLPSFLISI